MGTLWYKTNNMNKVGRLSKVATGKEEDLAHRTAENKAPHKRCSHEAWRYFQII